MAVIQIQGIAQRPHRWFDRTSVRQGVGTCEVIVENLEDVQACLPETNLDSVDVA